MGKRGPPKTPTRLKVVRGTNTKPTKEPQPGALVSLRPPKILTKEGKKIWRALAGCLKRIGLFTEIDTQAFTRYCDILPKWEKAKRILDEKGFYYPIFHKRTAAEVAANTPARIKFLQTFPEMHIYVQLGRELSRLEQQFGMTPAARASLDIENEGGEGSDLETELFG